MRYDLMHRLLEETAELGAGETAAPASEPAKEPLKDAKVPPTAGPDSMIKVGDTEYKASDLLEAYKKVPQLEEYRQHSDRLLEGPSAGDFTPYEKSMRYVMSEQGFTPEQIETFVKDARTADPATNGAPAPKEGEAPTQTPVKEPEIDPERMRVMEARIKQSEVEHMRRELEENIGKTLDSHEGIGTLLETAKRLNGEKDFGKRRDALKVQLKDETLRRINVRRTREGQFDMSWFREEAAGAADAILNQLRSVIGDPSVLGRAPETDTGSPSFSSTKPVETPEYKSGESTSNASARAQTWTTDVLSRLAVETSAGGSSKA